jgi:hypothetical protein
MRCRSVRLLLCVLVLGIAAPALAEVSRFEIATRADLSFAGYEKITGRVFFVLDPRDPRNAIIVDLDRAPRNDRGLVEFSADIAIVRPKSGGNGVAVVDVPNRGNVRLLPIMNRTRAAGADPEVGDGFLMQRGFAVVAVGWQFDVPQTGSLLRVQLPGTPPIAGLGFAAIRDVASWIRYAPEAAVRAQYVYAFGQSQSGRYLRDFVYHGFNSDERGRRVFDAMMPQIAGAGRIDLNRAGAMPNPPDSNATAFPFADRAERDPISGISEGLLENPRAVRNQPKLIYTNSDVEYWSPAGRAAALVHTAPDGSRDLTLPDNVRVYHIAGTQHTPGAFPPGRTAGQQPGNPSDDGYVLRALLVAMDRWVREGVEPPASRHPRLADGTLVRAANVAFPNIPGVQRPNGLAAPVRVGNALITGGAGSGAPLPYLVPQVDGDGNPRGGIRVPEVAVPLATYTGWNFSAQTPTQLVNLLGSYIPLARTREEREQRGDPRRSIQERYPSRARYIAMITDAAKALVRDRYLLAPDVDAIVERAGAHWDLLMPPAATANR